MSRSLGTLATMRQITVNRLLSPLPSATLASLTAYITAFAVTAGGMFGGLDFDLGRPIVAIVGGALLLLVNMILRPCKGIWLDLLPITGLLSVAWIWVWAVSVGAFGSPALVPDLAFAHLVGLAGIGALFTVGSIIGQHGLIRRQTVDFVVLDAALISVVGFISAALGLTISESLWQPGQQGRFAGTFGNANVAATFFAATAVLGFGALLQTLRQRPQDPATVFIRVAACLILFTACIATASRTAAATLVLALGVALAYHVAKHRWRDIQASVVFSGIAAALLFLAVASSTLLTRLGSISDDWRLRRMIWAHYAEPIRQSPWFGYGLGSFDSINASSWVSPEQAAKFSNINAAHNALLTLTLQGGIPYMAFIAGAVMLVIYRSIIAIKRGSATPSLAFVVAAVGVILTNSLVDIALDVPEISILFWFLLGLLWGGSSKVTGRIYST
jgi:O-antigen ligase